MLKFISVLVLLGSILAIYLNDLFYIIWCSLNPGQPEEGSKLFTAEELASFDGIQQNFLYLAILGNVFNVTNGIKHYGAGQTYNFFIGKDASRNFITGDLEKGLESDDISDLSQEELISLNKWLTFYRKEYSAVGKLIGRYYDRFGRLTPFGKQIQTLFKEAEQKRQNYKLDNQKFPPCNVEWDAEKGSRVWCTTSSGGVKRSWIGKPRQYYEAGQNSFRCACISKEHEHINSVKEYPGCNSDSDSCFVTI